MAQHRLVRRRRHHRSAVLHEPPPTRSAGDRPPLHAVRGTILDAGPHFLMLRTADGDLRMPLSPTTSVWHGGKAAFTALRPGRHAVVRPTSDGLAADRIWVDITRVSGTIVRVGKGTVEVEAGPHRGTVEVTIERQNLSHVLVRHPRFEPGYLADLICLRSESGPLAVRPGTPQPGYRSDEINRQALPGPLRRYVQGTATWFDGPAIGSPGSIGAAGSPGDLRAMAHRDVRGAAYPAVDPEGAAGGCPDVPFACAPLPYLSRYSDLFLRNDCTQRATTLQVIECGCAAARFCDRCVECGTSLRGRIAELTALSFVDLGGDLAMGCFNATLTVG